MNSCLFWLLFPSRSGLTLAMAGFTNYLHPAWAAICSARRSREWGMGPFSSFRALIQSPQRRPSPP
uniref:Macaca fascicularis brain cDNA, clone: QmoA-10653 n=1 Tax=Macaca fascicularis TaxID=9541 RepID=I7GN21_MACFA|nr:unnamed protein product [Macaca fascicularis]